MLDRLLYRITTDYVVLAHAWLWYTSPLIDALVLGGIFYEYLLSFL